jgi:thiol reductant ABC exporter CydC subunit
MACSGALIDKAALRPPLYSLTVLMAAVQLLALGRGPLRYAERLVSHDAALRVLGRLRLWLYDEVEPRSPAGLAQWRSGDLLARATGDVDALQDLYLRGISPLLVASSTSLVAVAVVAVILPVAGVVLAACLIGALVSTSALAWARQHRLGSTEAALRGALAGDIVELLQGAADLVAFGRDEEYLDRALASDEALARLARRRAWTAGAVSAVTVGFAGAAVIGLIAVAVPAISAHHVPGYMLAVLPLVTLGTFEVVSPVADSVSRLSHHVAAAERLLSVADLPVPVRDPVAAAPVPAATDIALRDAALRYGDDHPWALDGLTLSVAAGRRVALVGASGAGKSSVVNVLLRFWELAAGEAAIGGTPVGRLSQATAREMIGWVAQDTHLFNTTIRANIALARPDASEAEIVGAAGAAQLGPWIDSLPDGLDTQVGEQGARLSGGQRQRLALARALLAQSRILVLDEPTSGLDEPTAARLLEDVLATTAGTSMLYVTHRPDELAAFDEVYGIEDGRVVWHAGGDGRGRALAY